ncbi:MAG TPA: lysin, partial [Anaerolineae bacterium]|nr:lysin [Anaerolineae bacterium]
MPRVPTLDNFQTGISTATPNLNGPTAGEIQGRQAMQMGEAMGQAGGALSKIMLDAVDQQNQVRVNDAMNQAIAARLKLTHDKDAG